MAGYTLTIFLGSFLLFQVQPLVGKYILPWFGGSPTVWTTCMLSFQVMLVLGYGYAFLMDRWLTPFRQGLLHMVLLAASLLLLPIIPPQHWEPAGQQSPTWRILGLLAVTIGGPFVLLSSTSPLLQSWFARTHPGRSPYRFYALSNAGSLLALVSYPFVVEPALTLPEQAWTWSVAFGFFVALCGVCVCRICRWAGAPYGTAPSESAVAAAAGGGGNDPPDSVPPGWATVLLWLALTACGSVILLATTNQMCQEVAVVPFLWVLPLALYLGTFIICFDSPRWYRRSWFSVLLALSVVAASIALFVGTSVHLGIQIAVYCVVLLVCCMVCHGELVRLKPAPRYLTAFYLTVAVGGALGGIFTTLVAPRLFPALWEFHLGLLGCCLLLLVTLYRDRSGPLWRGRPRWVWAILLLIWAGLAAGLAIQAREDSKGALVRLRNFYGVLQVTRRTDTKDRPYYSLRHGRINHGFQYLAAEQRSWPTSYYGPNTGVGLAIRHHPRRSIDGGRNPLRIGVVGLGVGTLAAYGESGDLIRFYEINPDVVRLSQEYFTYRKNCPAEVDVVLGDARISLQRELRQGQGGHFDVLVIDAFSSDAIPVHLLTRECFEIYRRHLRRDGVLAVHVSNRYLDLGPLVRRLAAELGKQAVLFESGDDPTRGVDSATWVLVTGNRRFLHAKAVCAAVTPWPEQSTLPALWTDDFSNLFQVLAD